MKLRLHKKITNDALDRVLPGLDIRYKRRLVRANLFVDIRSWFFYKREGHFDRIPFAPHETAWEAGTMAIEEALLRAMQDFTRSRNNRCIVHIGRALHTLQDAFSHSNYGDLTEQEKQLFLEHVLAGAAMPEMVQFCSVSSALFPVFGKDGYSHSAYHRDGGQDGCIDGAREATCRILERYVPYFPTVPVAKSVEEVPSHKHTV